LSRYTIERLRNSSSSRLKLMQGREEIIITTMLLEVIILPKVLIKRFNRQVQTSILQDSPRMKIQYPPFKRVL
jgi:hypothetical protein